MKTKTNSKSLSCLARSFYSLTIKSVILSTFILTGVLSPVNAQLSQDKKHSWWYGVATGANVNIYRSSIQELNSSLTSPVAFNKGSGLGLYFAPLVEFRQPGWGIMLQAGYDSRKGSFDEKTTDCGCTDDLSTSLSYITVESNLRFAPFKSDFYLFVGPRLAFNLNRSFTFKEEVNSDFNNQTAHTELNENFSSIKKTIFSMQIGVVYDIPVSSKFNQTQFMFSPFISFQPYFGQNPRSIETWKVTTLRFGVALKYSNKHKISTPQKITNIPLF